MILCFSLALSLLVLRVLTNAIQALFAPNNLAVFADRLYGYANLHNINVGIRSVPVPCPEKAQAKLYRQA
jgi:hypothetical protein